MSALTHGPAGFDSKEFPTSPERRLKNYKKTRLFVKTCPTVQALFGPAPRRGLAIQSADTFSSGPSINATHGDVIWSFNDCRKILREEGWQARASERSFQLRPHDRLIQKNTFPMRIIYCLELNESNWPLTTSMHLQIKGLILWE